MARRPRQRPARQPLEVEVTVHPDVALDPLALRDAAVRRAGVRGADVRDHRVIRRAIDARRGRPRIHLTVQLSQTEPLVGPLAGPPMEPVELTPMATVPEVIVVGAGPAGLFCALELARRGVRSVVLERGKAVQPRRRDLAALCQRGALDPESNYCFGEGGAGTFSDGKLYTRAKKRGPPRQILETFVGYGADPDILVEARPHIGTNKLPGIVTRLREHLAMAGVEVRFNHRVAELAVHDGRVVGVRLADRTVVPAAAVVVATGHSARDVLGFLHGAGVALAAKPTAIGVRIEHPQSFVDRIQYGELAGHPALGPASYRLVEQACGRGVFSFCMCPGGHIAPAATSPGEQVVNGWSPSRRNGRFANSGFVVEVDAETLAQFGLDPTDPLAGMALQQRLEREAYQAGGGHFVGPAQRLTDLVAGRTSSDLPPCSYPRGIRPAPLHTLLGPLAAPIRQALAAMDTKMPGFVQPDGVAVGVESRTSSPVRVERHSEHLESPSHPGLYPCGEGAGYAGGIVSAAIDGLRVAEAIARSDRLRSRGAARSAPSRGDPPPAPTECS